MKWNVGAVRPANFTSWEKVDDSLQASDRRRGDPDRGGPTLSGRCLGVLSPGTNLFKGGLPMRRLVQTAFAFLGIACLVPGLATVARADAGADRAEIERETDAALGRLYASVKGSEDVAKQAAGILVFPEIFKVGFIVGGHRGDGALRVGGKSVAYYKTTGVSFGLQAGAEKHSMALMFMTQEALQRFRDSSGWDVGADASVTVVDVGASGGVDASRINKPVQAFVYGPTGLMGSLSLEGTKISKSDLQPAM